MHPDQRLVLDLGLAILRPTLTWRLAPKIPQINCDPAARITGALGRLPPPSSIITLSSF